jgi:CSLREA domain-containing protein
MRRPALLVAIWLCVLGTSAALQDAEEALGVSFTVNSTADAVDAIPGDGACATPAGKCTLRAAIQETNALPGADAISVPTGSYRLAIPGALEEASLTGDLDITGDLTISGAGVNGTIIDGNQLDRVIEVRQGAFAEISGVTVKDGSQVGSLGGGGIAVNTGSSLTLRKSLVKNNRAMAFAGGVGSIGTAITVIDSTIIGNLSQAAGGGIASNSQVTLIRTTVSNNISQTGPGGVACCAVGDITVTDSVFSGNTGGANGGGLGLASTKATVTNSTFSGNIANGADGGGGILALAGVELTVLRGKVINNRATTDGGGIRNFGTATISESIISGNAANPDTGFGGGVRNDGSMTVSTSTVSENTGLVCGGLCNFNTLTVRESGVRNNAVKGLVDNLAGSGIGQFAGSLEVSDSLISGNSNQHGVGGGIGAFARVVVSGTTISGNFTGGLFGGGMGVGQGTVEVRDSTISGNSTTNIGGGIASSSVMTLTNVTISGNSARFDGGGIAATAQTTLNNVTITNNTADADGNGTGDGGGIATVADPVTISNTIIAGNADIGGEQPDCNKNGLILSQGYNLIQHITGCPFVVGPGDITGQDPKLGPLANNGGRTQTHALLRGSPAIDAGNPAAPSGSPTCETTDQRGVARPQDGNADGVERCDIGAFERRAGSGDAGPQVVELPVEFQVINSNTTSAACPSDNAPYTVRGHLVGPESGIYGPAPRAITVYVHGFSSSEPNWAFKLVPGYDLPVEMANLGHVSLNINRLGYSPSDQAPGMLSCVGSAADVVHQIIGQLRSPGAALPGGERVSFSKVVLAGHDTGGTIVEVEAYSYKDIDGLFVSSVAETGFSETVTEWSIGASEVCLQGGEPSDQGTPNYHHFPPMTDEELANDEALLRRIFYNTDEAVFQAVKEGIATGSRQLNPCGDIGSVPGAVTNNLARLHEVTVPVLYLLGDHDIGFTEEGGRRQGGLYSGSDDVTSVIMEETPHFWMWGRTAPDARSLVSDWLCSRGFVSAGVDWDKHPACG